MIDCKSEREIELMRHAGHVVALVFESMRSHLVPGISTQELDELAEEVMIQNDCKSSSKGYYGYPGAICISVNDTLIHGIPSTKIIIKEGDIVSFDVVVNYHGYHADATRTYGVGVISERAKKLMEVTEASWYKGAEAAIPGNHIGDISNAIQTYVESYGYSLPREFTGHGIGKSMHEDPSIPNYGKAGTGPLILEGMTFAIEPMVNEGRKDVRTLGDGWTVKTKDGKLSCHYENTILVTKDGYEILTKL